jgi:hypothetical protein
MKVADAIVATSSEVSYEMCWRRGVSGVADVRRPGLGTYVPVPG